jgi:hypothetical protein
MTKAEVAKCLEDFLLHRGGRWDWDDFISIPLEDPDLDTVRRRCAALPDRYPTERPHQYRSEEGIAALNTLLAGLRE